MSALSPSCWNWPRSIALVSLLALNVAGCEGHDELGPNDDKADDTDPLSQSNGYNNNPLLLPFDGPFDMCFDAEGNSPTVDKGVDMNAARWLSFISANEYAHYAHFAPVLEQMGFGDIGEGEAWVESGRTIMRARQSEEGGFLRPGVSAIMEKSLVQTVVPGKKVQFFAAGEIRNDEFKDFSTQVLWLEHRTEPVVIIGFRGTQVDKTQDILADINVLRKDVDGFGPVHNGFLRAFKNIEPILKAKLEAESGRDLKIWVTGHSLGGALSSLASTTILNHMENDSSYDFEGVYTFGQPRVGNSEFIENLDTSYEKHDVSVMRFRNGDDMVSQIPWNWMGYRHTGNLMHLRADDVLDTDAAEQDPGGTDAVDGSMADHSIDTMYYPRIVQHYEAGATARSCSYELD